MMDTSAAPRYDGYILDLDGTIYLGEQLIPGAREAVKRLHEVGRRVVYLSNKPLEPRSSYAAKLNRLGIAAAVEDVINSTQALIHYLRAHCANAVLYAIGERALLAELTAEGFVLSDALDEIDIVVAAFDRTLNYAKLNTAHQALVRGARFFATNADRTCPIEGGGDPRLRWRDRLSGGDRQAVASHPERRAGAPRPSSGAMSDGGRPAGYRHPYGAKRGDGHGAGAHGCDLSTGSGPQRTATHLCARERGRPPLTREPCISRFATLPC